MVALTHDRKEDQDLVEAVRDGDTIAVRLRERTFTPEEFRDFQKQIKRTAWLARCQELLDEETTVRGRDIQDEGECHECGFQGLMVENRQRTVYCPKCRSTNVSWPVIENGLNSETEDDNSGWLCGECKSEFWSDERAAEEVAEVEKEWCVEKDGTVVWTYSCENGHRWERRQEPMNGKHRHPGHTRRHPVDRVHQEHQYEHPVPENDQNNGDET